MPTGWPEASGGCWAKRCQYIAAPQPLFRPNMPGHLDAEHAEIIYNAVVAVAGLCKCVGREARTDCKWVAAVAKSLPDGQTL